MLDKYFELFKDADVVSSCIFVLFP